MLIDKSRRCPLKGRGWQRDQAAVLLGPFFLGQFKATVQNPFVGFPQDVQIGFPFLGNLFSYRQYPSGERDRIDIAIELDVSGLFLLQPLLPFPDPLALTTMTSLGCSIMASKGPSQLPPNCSM
jgi:hypothetical protein